MNFKFHNITTKMTLLIILCCFAQVIAFAQQPQVIKARAYDTNSQFTPATGGPSTTESDKNWALSIIELQNPAQGFGVAGFRTTHTNGCDEPGEDCIFKQPTILKLDANLDREWEYPFEFPKSRQFTTIAESNNGTYLFAGAKDYIGRVVTADGDSNAQIPLDFRLLTPPLVDAATNIPTWTSNSLPTGFANDLNTLVGVTFSGIRYSELVNNSGNIIGIGSIEIRSDFVNGSSAVLPNGIACPGGFNGVNNCDVLYGDLLQQMAIFKFDYDLNIQSVHIIGRDNAQNLILIDLLSLYNPNLPHSNSNITGQYDFSNVNLNVGLDQGTGIELSYTGNTQPNGQGNGTIDGYIINGTLSEINLNNQNAYENADRVAFIAKINDNNGNLSLAWNHKISQHVNAYDNYINLPANYNPDPDCFIPTGGEITSAIGFKCIQNSSGNYVFTVGVNYLDVTTDVRERLDCSINTNFNTFFRQADIILIEVNKANGVITKNLHLGQFTGEDFVPEILETMEQKLVYKDEDNDCELDPNPEMTTFNQYVINGAVSNNSVIDPLTFGGLENAGRLVFVDKSTFAIAKDYPFFEGLNDLCTFSTDYTSSGHIVICANNNANFDDYALMEICPNYGDEDPYDCIPQTCDCLGGALLPTHETVFDQGVPNSMNNRTEIDGGTPDRSATQTFSRITVKSGTTLTIKNITIEMSERIVVETGAKLIVDNATLTATCDNLIWVGIEVYGNAAWGHPSRFAVLQTNYPNNRQGHGVVIIKNSTIEYAQNGVKTKYKSSDQTHDDHNGIVLVENSIFLNNVCGVVLIGNDAPVVSDLLDTEFIINDDFRTGNSGVEVPITQVRLKNVSDYLMEENTFISHQEEYGKSKAIWTDDTDFNLTDSHFTNFDHGIYAANGLGTLSKQTIVEDCTFTDNARAMIFTGYHADIDDGDNFRDRGDFGLFIHTNIIHMRDELQGHYDTQEANWGIRLEACRDYLVSKNIIDGGYQHDPSELETSSAIYTNGYAIQAYNSDEVMGEANYIQKNEIGFDNNINTVLHSGVYAWNDNSTLQILCNNFTNDMFYAANLGASPTNRPVALDQGSCGILASDKPETAPAGNTFSASLNGPPNAGHRNFTINGNNSLDITYHYTGTAPSLNGNRVIPTFCNEQPTNCNAYENDEDGVVITSTGGGGIVCPVLSNEVDLFEKMEDEIKQNMALLTMYGRPDKSAEISAAKNKSVIKQLISTVDLFLSDNELIALSNKVGDFTLEVLTILEENAPLSNVVLEALSKAIANVPIKQRFLIIKNQVMVDGLFEHTEGLSLRTQKEQEVRQLVGIQLTIPTKYIPQDCTKKIKPEEVIENLVYLSKNTALNKLPLQKLVLSQSLKAANFAMAKETLEAIEIGDNENLKRFVLLKQFEIEMLQEGKTVNNLNKKEIATLAELANDSDNAGILARNTILSINDESTQFFTPETEEPTEEKVKKVANPLWALNELANFVYPNPGSDVIAIDINGFAQQSEHLNIKIYSSTGYLTSKNVANNNDLINFNISKIPQGTYIVEVIDEKTNVRKRSKLIITR